MATGTGCVCWLQYKRVKQFLEWPKVFQEVKVLIFRDNGTGWW